MGLRYFEYEGNVAVYCHHCKQQWPAKQLEKGEYHPESNIVDLECPHCHEHLTFVQFPVDHTKPYDREEDRRCW